MFWVRKGGFIMVLSDIRKSARECLSGRWGKSVLITLIFMAFEFVLGFISSLIENIAFLSFIFNIATIVISIPISYGLIISFMKLKRGENVECYEFFTFGFSNFARSWKVAGNMLLKMWLPILLYVVAIFVLVFAVAFGAVASSMSGSTTFVVIATIIGIGLVIASFVYLFITALSYSLSYIVAFDNESMTEKETVLESKKLMTGNRGKLVLLQLSFIGWAILSMFTLYIGLLWLIPYMQVAIICFYEVLKDGSKEE